MTSGTEAERVAELETDNRRLRRLLDGRDTPGELRHRLRSTLALLRAVVRKSAETERDLPGFVAHLEDRLDAIMRAQAYADQHGTVRLQATLADELLQYGASEGDRLLLSGPAVALQPRAGQVVALAIHELAVNAVEHGAFGAGKGRLEVRWSVSGPEAAAVLVLTWAESGASPMPGSPMPGSPMPRPARHGFGTEVLTRILPYELQAETEVTFGPDGLSCVLRIPLTERIGGVVTD